MDSVQVYAVAFYLAWVLMLGITYGLKVGKWWAAASDVIMPASLFWFACIWLPLPLAGRIFGWW